MPHVFCTPLRKPSMMRHILDNVRAHVVCIAPHTIRILRRKDDNMLP